MSLKAKQLPITLFLGVGLTLGLLAVLIAFLPSTGTSHLRIAHAAGPLYVATTGSDAGNGCTDSANPCATVQHALDVAAPGDEIRVATGVYTGVNARPRNDLSTTGVVTQVVYISKTATIRGGYSSDFNSWNPDTHPATLDAQGLGRVLYITGDISPTIEGLRIIGGHAAGLGGGLSSSHAGGGMYAISATVTFNNNQIFNNMGGPISQGGGVYVLNGKATLNNNTFLSNTSEAGGGAAFVNSEAILSGNAVMSNTAPFGGGGVFVMTGKATLSNNTILSNTSVAGGGAGAGGGGGAAFVDSEAILSGNAVMSNTADIGGGLAWGGSMVSLLGNTIMSNTAQSGGGVYVVFGGIGNLDGNIIQGNKALGAFPPYNTTGGGGVAVGLASSITLTNTVVRHNVATQGSPGILVSGSEAHLLHTTIAGNSGGSNSGVELVQGSTAALTNIILVSHTIGISVSAGSTATLNGILWFGNGFPIGGPGNIDVANAFTGNPAFAADGYHLTAGSAAIDRGVNAGVTTDIDGALRITLPDLGADEYVLTTYLPAIFKSFGP